MPGPYYQILMEDAGIRHIAWPILMEDVRNSKSFFRWHPIALNVNETPLPGSYCQTLMEDVIQNLFSGVGYC